LAFVDDKELDAVEVDDAGFAKAIAEIERIMGALAVCRLTPAKREAG